MLYWDLVYKDKQQYTEDIIYFNSVKIGQGNPLFILNCLMILLSGHFFSFTFSQIMTIHRLMHLHHLGISEGKP